MNSPSSRLLGSLAVLNPVLAGQNDFLAALVDSLEEQLAVIDESGTIVFVNAAWRRFGVDNGAPVDIEWCGANYLAACRQAKGDALATRIANGIERILGATAGSSLSVEYPCHAPHGQRWFRMRASPMQMDQGRFVVIVHENITRRKLAEQRAAALATQDPLTGLANRRAFNQALRRCWQRCRRTHAPVSLLSVDIDYFKQLNDTFGHPAGDACLKLLARILRRHARRAEDLAARLGGEEFALLLPDTDIEHARQLAERLRQAITRHCHVEGVPHRPITASIGVVGCVPTRELKPDMLIAAADVGLYAAKQAGRDRVIVGVA